MDAQKACRPKKPVRAIIVDSSDQTFDVVKRQLAEHGLAMEGVLVHTPDGLRQSLERGYTDLILAEDLPSLPVLKILRILDEKDGAPPLLLFSDRLSEAEAAQLMAAGACDFVCRQTPQRLAFAVRRELQAAAIRQNERNFRRIAEQARELIFTIDLDGNVVYVNDAVCRLGGYGPGDLIGRNIAQLIETRAIDEDQNSFLYEADFKTRDGDQRPVEVTSSLLTGSSGPTGMLMVARDVRDKKAAAEALRQQREQLFQSEKMASLGVMVAGVAHEINNPLTALQLNLPALNKAWHGLRPILDECFETRGDFNIGHQPYSRFRHRLPAMLEGIQNGVESVRTIVCDLKDFSRQGSGELRDLVDASGAVKKSVRLIRSLIKRSTSAFELRLADNLPCFRGNSQRIEQVMINLIMNACQALTDPGQAVIVATAYAAEDNTVRITVQDSGKGMPPEVLAKIGTLFFTTKAECGGTGMGLAISEQIIQDHGGSLSIDSKPGIGTTALIRIPLAPEALPNGH